MRRRAQHRPAEILECTGQRVALRSGACTAVVKAVLALHYMEHDPFAALRAA